jgi:hypothetical protein
MNHIIWRFVLAADLRRSLLVKRSSHPSKTLPRKAVQAETVEVIDATLDGVTYRPQRPESRGAPSRHTQPEGASLLDPALEDQRVTDLMRLIQRGAVGLSLPSQRHSDYPGETPYEGAGAVARWLALHDRAVEMRAALRPGDVVAERNVRRALRSVLLYEHQITPTTRRQARTELWRRTHDGPLPAFAVRSRWARCHCAHCQAADTPTPDLEEVIVLASA